MTLLTLQQAAAVLTVSVRTLDRMVQKGVVRQHRIGANGPRRFLMKDIEQALIPDQSPDQSIDRISDFISNTIKTKG